MKFLKLTFSPSQIKALLHKDVLVRWRQPTMSIIQLVWPCLIFMLLYLIRLKFGPVEIEDCQFPTRLLPTKNNVLPGFYSYICSIQNKCLNTTQYEEYSKFENAPMKPIIDIVQIFINDDRLFNSVIELPEKANFIGTVTALMGSGQIDTIRNNVDKVIALVPEVEKALNGSFDIKKLFSDRKTFVKAGNLLCGFPFPSTESIPLVNDILYSEDFSEINDDELESMPTKYCKKLYLDVTSTNHGKLTWNAIKPLIHGKILFSPNNEQTQAIMKYSNVTFEEINRLQMLAVSAAEILNKMRNDEDFQKSLNSLLKLAETPFVKQLVGDDFNIDQIKMIIERIRTDPVIYDVINTIKNLMECFTVDRFVAVEKAEDLRLKAYELNHKRLFYAAIHFNETNNSDISYKFHMDTENTQPTFENRNRFWFPGPSGSMLRDMKYHRGFVQIKQVLDLAIIKAKKDELKDLGVITEKPTTTTESPFNVEIFDGDDDEELADEATDNDNEDDDDWFTSGEDVDNNKTSNAGGLVSSHVPAVGAPDLKSLQTSGNEKSNVDVPLQDDDEDKPERTTLLGDLLAETLPQEQVRSRQKRQSILDLFSSFSSPKVAAYDIDQLQYYTKQFPYPAYIDDDFKTGLYLAQAVQMAFFLGLVAQIASCVRHRIWMRESRNTMIMRAMGLKPCSEMTAWTIVTFVELFVLFVAISIILYTGGILMYTKWLFVMIFLLIFGACLIAFCYMCSTFFTSATIGAVATAIFFFISFCPYILVLLFDAQLNSLENFAISLSFTTAFAQAWSQIMRLELQQIGLSFEEVFHEGFRGDYGFGVFMIILDMFIYIAIGYFYQRYKNDEFQFIEVQRESLDSNVGATLTNVSKIYNDTKLAVANISLAFPRDQVTCLLGRNGAGKSTIIKMLTGQVVQTSGRVILSQAMTGSTEYDKIGVCSQDNILIPNLTAREHLELYGRIKLKHNYHGEVAKTLKSLQFGKHENFRASQLSGGFQRRLCVAIAFIGSPNVVILDEPCNGVDSKARKDIWELIERLRKGRAVIFATHFLDEAEFLSDNIVIMKNGKIIAKHNTETMKNYSTSKYEVSMHCCDANTSDEVKITATQLMGEYNLVPKTVSHDLSLELTYEQQSAEFLKYLQDLQETSRIRDLTVDSQNLEQLFKDLDRNSTQNSNGNSHHVDILRNVLLKKVKNVDLVRSEPLTRCEAIHQLLWKRLVHFSRNYRMLVCVLLLPAIFEILAMWFVAYRVEDDFDKVIKLSRELYPKTTQFLSMEKTTEFTEHIYNGFKEECSSEWECKEFSTSEKSFNWVLESLKDYHGKRYGGYSFNDTKSLVWYNNKGYHAMMGWLNDLNTHLMQTELNDTSFSINSYNEPWKLGFAELSTSSILRQAGDSCMVFILLIAFSLVVAVASVYLVSERMNGEKLQQKLCGVDASTYWGVAFIWDFMIIILATLVCTSIILAFGMPVFVNRQQIWGIIALGLFFGFACIPAIHVLEKCFTDPSMAIVTIFCMNVIIPLFTIAFIVLLGVVGDSPTWDEWRYFLNRAFLIFPQHALGDGLLEICKNYMVALVFQRYDIDSYKNPINSDLLRPHFLSMFILGIFFIILNVLLESGMLHRWKEAIYLRIYGAHEDEKLRLDELRIVSIQNSLKRNDKYDSEPALWVNNISKCYRRGEYAVKNVSFTVKPGECFGLLGKNGAGKSTIFKMLSGQMFPTIGSIEYNNPEISYCPQTNTLDTLLTVRECIEFYGRLRRIKDIPQLVSSTLECFQLESYRDVLVKNLSGGNRRKLTVATTCCGHTSTVLMDEPTSDMDPVTRALVYRTIDELLAEQRAIVLTSHSISEIDEICHRIAVLKDGQMLTCSSPESLKNQYGGFYNIVVYCDATNLADLEKDICEQFPQCVDLQAYSQSIKFSLKIEAAGAVNNVKENAVDIPQHMQEKATNSVGLSDLFNKLETLKKGFSKPLLYSIHKCRLDAVFERVLDSSEMGAAHLSNGQNGNSTAYSGTPSTGYIHNGYVETETVT